MLDTFLTYIRKLQTIDFLVIFLAISLQIQITLFAHEDYLGLRVGLADICLPFIGLYVLFSLLNKKSRWPQWHMPKMLYWLAGLALVMSIALLNGYFVQGTLSSWAFINKYIGFFLLVAYLLLGGWIITNADDSRKPKSIFITFFTAFFVLTVFTSMITLFLQYFIPYPLWLAHYPWDGLMANRNAFVVIFVLSFVFIIWNHTNDEIKIPQWITVLFWLSLPIFFIYNDSRTGWLVSAILIIIFLSKESMKRAYTTIPVILAGTLIAYASYSVTTSIAVLQSLQMQNLLSVTDGETSYKGDKNRFIAIEDGIELYQQHNPVIGAGLGSYKPFQIGKRGEFLNIMDFTGLWLLVETGALGLLTFAAFFIACIWCLYKIGFRDNQPYHRAMLTFLIIFAGMSILHELMYTRVLWFTMGLALATSFKRSGNEKQPNV